MVDSTHLIALASVAALVAFAAGFAARWLAPRAGLVDRPGERKIHPRPMPTGGGMAVWLGVVVPLAVLATLGGGGLGASASVCRPELALILFAATAMLLIGLVDDLRPLGWKAKLAGQALVAGALVAAHGWFVAAPWSQAQRPPMLPIGAAYVAWIVLATNSLNLLDNMDGLCAGVGMVAAAALAVLSRSTHETGAEFADGTCVVALPLLAASLLGFLHHNRPPARLFLGDAGSYFVGSLLAVGAWEVGGGDGPFSPAAALGALCALAVPLYDTASVVVIRLVEGRNPFVGDRSHLSHRLAAAGLGRGWAVAALVAAAAICAAAGIGVALTGHAPIALVVLAVLAGLETRIAVGRRRHGDSPGDPLA